MNEHYYSEKPTTKSEPKTWKTILRGHDLTFVTDHGVFSKDDIDFGSRLLIDVFEPPQVEGPFLDMGCGYGPIGITLAKTFSDRSVTMVDINERAVECAKKNVLYNQVNAEVFQSDLFSKVEGSFAAIITNPPIRAGKSTVFQIFEDAKKLLLFEGELWVVIQKKQGAPSTEQKLKELYGMVQVVAKKKGYYIFSAKNI